MKILISNFGRNRRKNVTDVLFIIVLLQIFDALNYLTGPNITTSEKINSKGSGNHTVHVETAVVEMFFTLAGTAPDLTILDPNKVIYKSYETILKTDDANVRYCNLFLFLNF